MTIYIKVERAVLERAITIVLPIVIAVIKYWFWG